MFKPVKSFRVAALTCVIVASGAEAQPASPPSDACAAAEAYNADHEGVTFLVLRDGHKICENYSNGGAATQPYLLASGTKSFTGLMAAAAVQDGFLTLDEPAADTIAEWKSDPRKSIITIRQLLSLTSGIGENDVGRPPSYAKALLKPAEFAPGTKFKYSPDPFQIFGEVMKRKLAQHGLHESPLDYLERRILTPIGVAPAYWASDEDGNPTMPSGSAFTAEQWAKVGEFVRHDGVVDGKPILDQATLAQEFKGSEANPTYGVSWWLIGHPGGLNPRGKPIGIASVSGVPSDTVMAAGAGDQRLYIIPSLKLTIVRQTDKRNKRPQETLGNRFSDGEFLRLVIAGVTKA